MATAYTFKFTDTSKDSFTVSPYTSNGTLSPSDGNFLPFSVTANTTLKLYGKGMQEYGEGIEQNLIYMLENFAARTSPLYPIEGQLWYGLIGSPPTQADLSIHNGTDFSTKVLLNTGISPMSGDFDLNGNSILNVGNAINTTDALNMQTGDVRYVNVTGDTMTSNLSLGGTGSPSTALSPTDPSHAINKQYADNNYVNIIGDTMTGELILRANIGVGSPVNNLEAASIEYVDNQILASSDSYLSAVAFQSYTGAAKPGPSENEIIFTIVGRPSIAIGGINFEGQNKPASEISTTSTGDIPSGSAQTAINLLESKKLDRDGSDSMTSDLDLNSNTVINLKEPINPQDAATKYYVDLLSNPTLVIPDTKRNIMLTTATDTYQVFKNSAAINKLRITLNGQIQYANSIGYSDIGYDIRVNEINETTLTTLEANTNYSFDITSNGGSPLTTKTIEINLGGSPYTPISTHQELLAAINAELFDISGVYPRMSITGKNNSEQIASSIIGASSSVVISPPTSGTGTYLFDVPAAIAVTAVTLGTSSPAAPDSLTVAGDQTATFTIGKKFTLRNTTTDGTTGTLNDNFDSVYTVATSTFGTDTVIELVEQINLNGTNITGFGNIYLTNIAGLVSVNQVDGVDYDYTELSSLDGTNIAATYSEVVRFIRFNTLPPTAQTLEIILSP